MINQFPEHQCPLHCNCLCLQSTKSPGSRSSVVSIGSVCGAAAAGAALTPQQIIGRASDELEAGKYTPIMKLDFGSTRKRPHVKTAVLLGLVAGICQYACSAVVSSSQQSADVKHSRDCRNWRVAYGSAHAHQPPDICCVLSL